MLLIFNVQFNMAVQDASLSSPIQAIIFLIPSCSCYWCIFISLTRVLFVRPSWKEQKCSLKPFHLPLSAVMCVSRAHALTLTRTWKHKIHNWHTNRSYMCAWKRCNHTPAGIHTCRMYRIHINTLTYAHLHHDNHMYTLHSLTYISW